MRDLVDAFLGHTVSRRDFVRSLSAMGVSAAGINVTIDSAEAVTAGTSGMGTEVTGTGGDLMVEQMKAAGVRYFFTNPGSFEVGLFDAFLDQPMQLIMGLHEGIVISMLTIGSSNAGLACLNTSRKHMLEAVLNAVSLLSTG